MITRSFLSFIVGFGEKICRTNLLVSSGRNSCPRFLLDLYVCFWLQEPMFSNPTPNYNNASPASDYNSDVCAATTTCHGIQWSTAKHVTRFTRHKTSILIYKKPAHLYTIKDAMKSTIHIQDKRIFRGPFNRNITEQHWFDQPR